MAKKDSSFAAVGRLLSSDAKKVTGVIGSVDLNPANVGYRNLRSKVKAARTAKAPASKAGAERRSGKPMAGEAKAAVKTPAKVRGSVSMSGDSIKAISAKKTAPAKAKAAPQAASKTSSYGNDSYAQHESFRKELESGGGRAAWSMNKQVEAGGAKVEISKSASGTSLNAELDKFQTAGGKSAKKDIKLGVAGRTGGKWHLGKKVGKG